ncbi:hypothetical protein ACIRP3_02015 [Streptomyces sp. NPDC101209]|uniref:hypothetical protein n=1 Tax=Streptomyces sp. NPDC101209 TaxID=3366129 RepID=UPI00381CA2CD
MGGRYRPPAPVAVRVASHPLRSATVLAVPLAALGGSTFDAFTELTRFLQAVGLGTGMMLFFALLLRLERLTQLHYERVGYAPATPLHPCPPRPADLRRALGRLGIYWVAGWGLLSLVFWGAERARGTPVSWLFAGAFVGVVLLVPTAVGYRIGRKRQRTRPPGRGDQ